VRAQSYANIDPQEPEWLIPGWVMQGGVTYVAGDGGVGKSFLTADWAARVTRGLAMPGDDQEPLPVGSVVLVSAEDDPHMSMAYRLRAAGADLSRVYDMTDDFTLPDGLATLREDMAEIGDVRLTVIDPLAAVSSIPITSGNVRIRRSLTAPLERFARSTGVAVVVIHHRTKAGRTAGAKAITDAARQVLAITRSTQDERIRVVAVEKSNIASDSGGTIAYTLTGAGLGTHVAYVDAPCDELAPSREPTVLEKIVAELRRNGPRGSQDIARIIGSDWGAVRTALTRGKATGEVVSPKRGVWTVPEPAEMPTEAPSLAAVK